MTDHRQAATLAAEAALREAAGDFAIDAALGFIRSDRSSEAYFRDSLPTLADGVIDAAAPHVAAAERERIRQASIKAIAGYVLTRRDGEAVGVTEFINDLLTEGTDHA